MGMQPSIADLAEEANRNQVTAWYPIARERVVPYRARTPGTLSPANGWSPFVANAWYIIAREMTV
jgi:hypothetical protein